jgi:hypothetical protein
MLSLRGLLLVVSLLLFSSCVISHVSCSQLKKDAAALDRLECFNVSSRDISVSGLSAGAFMAVQFQIIHSSWIKGVGVIAGGPFFCAQGNLMVATTACMTQPELLVPEQLAAETVAMSASMLVDPVTHVRDHKIYVFSGQKDSVIAPGVAHKLLVYYDALGVPADHVLFRGDFPAEHVIPTTSFGNACSYLGTPYVNNCGYSAAEELLHHIYSPRGGLNKPVQANPKNLLSFSQKPYLDGLIHSMADTGYIYIPDGCKDKSRQCALHVVFHGCEAYAGRIGTDFVLNGGYNEVAEANNIIVLYPQTKESYLVPFNPKGCWDWWGYTGSTTYSTRAGLQPYILRRMISDLVGREIIKP